MNLDQMAKYYAVQNMLIFESSTGQKFSYPCTSDAAAAAELTAIDNYLTTGGAPLTLDPTGGGTAITYISDDSGGGIPILTFPTVTITGTGFDPVQAGYFRSTLGGVSNAPVTYIDSTHISFVASNGIAGTYSYDYVYAGGVKTNFFSLTFV